MNQIDLARHSSPFLLTASDLAAPWSNFRLRAGHEQFTVSAPVPGDATLSSRTPIDSEWVTLGVSAATMPRLSALIGTLAVLFAQNGRKVCELRIEKLDSRFNLLIGRLHRRPTDASFALERRAS